MLPLNDEWLSWPPESLDGFFISQVVDEVPGSSQQKKSINQSSPEKVYEIPSTNFND